MQFEEHQYGNTETIHVAYCFDRNYRFAFGASVLSLILNFRGRGDRLKVHIVTDEVDEDFEQRLEQMRRIFRVDFKFYTVPGERLQRFSDRPTARSPHVSRATLYRMILPSVLGETVGRVLYLDPDTIVLGSVDEIFETPLNGAPVAGVSDIAEKKYAARYGIDAYINAGVLLLDLEQWRRHGYGEACLRALETEPDRYYQGDQCLINRQFAGSLKVVDRNWNRQVNPRFGPGDVEGAKLLHFIGQNKPWQAWYESSLKDYFWRYLSVSPWVDKEPEQPRSLEQYVRFARTYYRSGQSMMQEGARIYEQVIGHLQKRGGMEDEGSASHEDDQDSLYREICQRLQMFTPNSAGWSAGVRALAELAQTSASASIDGLSRLATRSEQKTEVTPEDLTNLSQTSSSEVLSKRLAELFRKYGSDKATAHNYHLLYGHILDAVSEAPAVLEIGLGSNHLDTPSNMGRQGQPGASLRAFRDALTHAQIYGADVDQRILFEEERIQTFYLDQTDMASYRGLGAHLPEEFELIIDDGLHTPGANLNTLVFGIDRLKPGGWIVIEDILPRMLPIWHLVVQVLPQGFEPRLLKASKSYLFAVRFRGEPGL